VIVAWMLAASVAAAGPQPMAPEALEAFATPSDAIDAPSDWWTSLGDEELDAAVEIALSDNPELAVAEAATRQASGAALSTGAALLPTASFDVTTTGQPLENVAFCAVGRPDFLDQPDADWCWQGSASLNARWNLDIFGRSTTSYLAARYDAEAARGNRHAQQLQIASRVANAYLDVVAATQQLALVEKQLASQRDLATIIDLRFEQGLATSLEVLQQRSAVSSTEALLPPARLSLQVAQQSLAILLGRDPSAPPSTAKTLPEAGAPPRPGTPSQLAARRPDLQAAMASYEASRSRLTSTTLELLPTLSANASAGWSYVFAPDLDTLEGWSVGGSLSVPLFNGGATHGRIRSSRAARDQAMSTWNQQLLAAASDVRNALAQDRENTSRREAVDAQLEAARLTYEESRERYLAGIDSFLNVLTAFTSLQQAELNSVTAHRDVLTSRIALFVALGGGGAPPSGVSP